MVILMINLLFYLIKEMTLYVGYIKNNTYLNPLNEDEEDYYVNDWLVNKNNISRNKLIEHNLRLVAHISKKYESTSVIGHCIGMGKCFCRTRNLFKFEALVLHLHNPLIIIIVIY